MESLELLSDFGVCTPPCQIIDNEQRLNQALGDVTFPVVLKTAEAGINHKSDYGGVVTGIESESELVEHYQVMSRRLGPKALIAHMAAPGTEIGLGMKRDPQFGPVIMVSAGGILIELLADRAVALAPVSRDEADEMLSSLKIDSMIRGIRGREPGHRESLLRTIKLLSQISVDLDCIEEVDINPVIVNPFQAVAVDALIVCG